MDPKAKDDSLYDLFSTPPGDLVLTSTPNKPKKPAKQQRYKKQQSTNLWDKCLKSNPELAEYVDNFNQSLEEAMSKPLDMSGD